jgi:hypothetical protein
VVWNSSQPQAIVNDTVVSVGDAVGEARVTRIEKEGVTLALGDREIHLSTEEKP